MENEIKVNEYVRIAGGIIARITNKNKDGLLIDRVIRDPMRQDGTIRDWCIFNDEKGLIVKHSENPEDLLEVGDIVELIDVLNQEVIYIWDDEMLKAVNEDIKNGLEIGRILTKEMMESISYKVKE